MKNQLKAGAILSYVNLLIGNLIPFFYTPIMLQMLGQAEYGLFGIANSVMGYIGLLNFGIGGSIVRYLSKYRALGQEEEEKRVAGLFIKIYSVICAVILCTGALFASNISLYGRSLSPEELEKLRILILLMTFNTGIFMPFSVYSSIIIAHERYVFNKVVNMITTIAAPALNLILLYFGLGSVGLVLSTTILNIIVYCIYVVYTSKRLDFKPSFKPAEKGLLKEIIHFSVFIFLASMVDVLYWSTDKLIIGWAKGTVETAVYNIGATFNGYMTSFSTALSGLLVPKLTAMAFKNAKKEEFTNIFIKVGRLQFIVVSFILSAFIVFGKQFIILWAGPEYERSYYVALLTMIPVSVPLIQNTGLNILYALNKHKFRSIVYACVAIVNVILTLIWVEKYGIVGAALATCLAYVVGNIIIINWYYDKKIGINIPLFWKNIIKMSPVMIIMGTVAWFAVKVFPINSWIRFLLSAFIYTLVYGILTYLFMMNDYEKDVIRKPVKTIIEKIKNR